MANIGAEGERRLGHESLIERNALGVLAKLLENAAETVDERFLAQAGAINLRNFYVYWGGRFILEKSVAEQSSLPFNAKKVIDKAMERSPMPMLVGARGEDYRLSAVALSELEVSNGNSKWIVRPSADYMERILKKMGVLPLDNSRGNLISRESEAFQYEEWGNKKYINLPMGEKEDPRGIMAKIFLAPERSIILSITSSALERMIFSKK